MEQTERIFKILDRQKTDVEFTTKIFGFTSRSNIRRVLASTSCFEKVEESHKGVADRYIRKTIPTPNDLTGCAGCQRLKGTASCPIFDAASRNS